MGFLSFFSVKQTSTLRHGTFPAGLPCNFNFSSYYTELLRQDFRVTSTLPLFTLNFSWKTSVENPSFLFYTELIRNKFSAINTIPLYARNLLIWSSVCEALFLQNTENLFITFWKTPERRISTGKNGHRIHFRHKNRCVL